MLKRKAYNRLLQWERGSAGKTAVLLKSTLAREFGRNEYKSCLFIDFFQAPPEVLQYFRDYSSNLDRLFLYHSTYYSTATTSRGSRMATDPRWLPSSTGSPGSCRSTRRSSR